MPAHELVPGDVLLLQPGDQICADVRLFEVNGLQVEEAMLAGESVPAGKHETPVDDDSVLGDRTSMAFGGTLVVAGTARGVVTATGAVTELGRISQLLSETAELETPLTRRLGRLARAITIGIVQRDDRRSALVAGWYPRGCCATTPRWTTTAAAGRSSTTPPKAPSSWPHARPSSMKACCARRTSAWTRSRSTPSGSSW